MHHHLPSNSSAGVVRRRRAITRASLGAALVLVAAAAALPAVGSTGAGGRAGAKERVIVVLSDEVSNPRSVAREHADRFGGRVLGTYEHALKGYVATLPPGAQAALEHDPRVVYVERDQRVEAFGELPTGVDRIQGDANAAAAINGVDTRVDVDIAVIDTGIAGHPDLNIAGGTNCTSIIGLFPKCAGSSFSDGNGHGTHVAGTTAALDNAAGVVGVAPGARLWGVKVLGSTGNGFMSDVAAGVDWVTARAGTIEVANMSLGCECTSQALDDALRRSADAGVVYVVAAGNNSRDAGTFSPANHPNVIAVSAMADFDGRPGGGAAATCRTDVDDTFADFSNFGPVVDLAAPGVCITSTWLRGGYNTISGTSMASPHAAGAAALWVASKNVARTSTRWSTVRDGLRTVWTVAQSSTCGFAGGRSGEPELLVAPC